VIHDLRQSVLEVIEPSKIILAFSSFLG
jgi:hypothetical protein